MEERTEEDEDDAGKGASKFSRFGLLDLDSAFTTTPAKGNTPRRSGTKGASPTAEVECDSTSKQLMDQLERVAVDVPKAAAEMLRNGLTPAKKSAPAKKSPAANGKRAVKRVNPANIRAKQRRRNRRRSPHPADCREVPAAPPPRTRVREPRRGLTRPPPSTR